LPLTHVCTAVLLTLRRKRTVSVGYGAMQLGLLPRASAAIRQALVQSLLDLSTRKMRTADIARAFRGRTFWRVIGLKAEVESGADAALLAESSSAHLRTLRLEGPKVSDEAVEALLPRLPALEALSLCKCVRITDRTLAAVAAAAAAARASGSGALSAFSLAWAPLVTDRGFAALGNGPIWTSLQLHGLPQLGANGLAALGPSLAHLKQLQLWSCERVDDVALVRLAPLLAELEACDLRRCDKVTSAAPLWKKCSALTSRVSARACASACVRAGGRACGCVVFVCKCV
jgi:hypothetical protein